MLNKLNFHTSKFEKRVDGTANIGDFYGKQSQFKQLNMQLEREISISEMVEYGDRRGYFYEIANILEDLADRFEFIGWTEINGKIKFFASN